MPGMGDLQSMFSKMGMNTGKGSGKVNVNAMQTNLEQKLKGAKNRERILKNLADRQQAQAQAQAQAHAQAHAQQGQQDNEVEDLVYTTGESAVRSVPGDKKKKKKNKNKK